MIKKVFDNLSRWRNLPNYQLERRADIFFSLYISDIVTAKTGTPDDWVILPEFPVPIKAIYQVENNKSFKIDYLVIGPKSEKVVFIELKTDNSSRREKQDWYLEQASKAGLYKLLTDLKDVFLATDSKKKYLHLFSMLRDMGLVNYDNALEIKVRGGLPGVSEDIERIEICDNKLTRTKPEIIYIQPLGSGEDIVNFSDITEIIADHYDDPISHTFSKALNEWAIKKAGEF